MVSTNTNLRQLVGIILPTLFAGTATAENRPLALVEKIQSASETGLAAFDYVYENDKIDLRPEGEISLAYFDRCEIETFTGGVLRLKIDRTKISKGGVSTKQLRPCQTSVLRLSRNAREAGVAVKRVTPFPKEEWRELSIATSNPIFIWPSPEIESGATSIRVVLLEAKPVELVWQGKAEKNYVAYPNTAPPLKPGLPYEVTISYDDDHDLSTVFSVDPGLELPEGILTSAVPLGL